MTQDEEYTTEVYETTEQNEEKKLLSSTIQEKGDLIAPIYVDEENEKTEEVFVGEANMFS